MLLVQNYSLLFINSLLFFKSLLCTIVALTKISRRTNSKWNWPELARNDEH